MAVPPPAEAGTRSRGAVSGPASDITPDPTAGPLDKCAAAEEAVISTIGMDVKRRAMFLDLNACRPKDCPGTLRTLFFRLPKTSK